MYVAHVPPGVQPVMIRQLLSVYGEVTRIFFKPRPEPRMLGAQEIAAAQRKAKRSRNVHFREGWVEFANKKLARLVAEQLHQTPMGVGKQRKKFYATSLWNLSYLSKVRWEHLADKFEVRTATRVKRVRNEMATAKREIADIDDALRKRRRKQAPPPMKKSRVQVDDDDDNDDNDNYNDNGNDNDNDDEIDEEDFARQIERERDEIAVLARTVQPSATQLNSVRDTTSRTLMPDKLLKML